MPNSLSVPESEWRVLFDRVSSALSVTRAEIEVASLDLGEEIVGEWVPMIGIRYDARNDFVDVALDCWNHLIRHPREILVEDTPAGLVSVAIVDEDDARQVVWLKEPLMLPAASEQPVMRHRESSANRRGPIASRA